MRDDLLDAQAVIDWAVSDLPILRGKIERWRNSGPYRLRGDLDTDPRQKIIRLCDVQPIPAIINAETGVIIHSIRSSLDILAVALAERNGASDPKDVYFPISKSRSDFFDAGARGGLKKIKRLSAADQKTIENLKPYNGGNDYLAALHDLDVTRKHRRLVSVYSSPSAIIISPNTHRSGVQFTHVWQGFKNDAIIATGPRHASEDDIVLSLEIRLAEPRIVTTKPLLETLSDFASLAASIIGLFDGPNP